MACRHCSKIRSSYTPLTFAVTVSSPLSLFSHACASVLAFLCVGLTATAQDDDLSMSTLVQDTIDVLARIIPEATEGNDRPQTVIVGHRCVCFSWLSW